MTIKVPIDKTLSKRSIAIQISQVKTVTQFQWSNESYVGRYSINDFCKYLKNMINKNLKVKNHLLSPALKCYIH